MILLTALVTALVMVPQSTRLALVLGGIDHPDARKVHRTGTPRLGGIGIMLSLLLAVLLFMDISVEMWGFLGGALIVFLTGLVDDLANLTPRKKLGGQFLAASVAVLAGGIELHSFGDLFGLGELRLGYLSVPITIFAIVGLANAINLLDGLDGLAAGVCAMATATFAVLAYSSGNDELLALCLALLGALIGFLKYNTHPARTFMGDSGSLLLGYCMGTFSIMLVSGGNRSISEVTPLMVLAVPIFDTLLVMGKRLISGQRLFSPDNSHFHHRLLGLCHEHHTTVRIIHGVCYVLSGLALACRNLSDSMILAILLGAYGVLLFAVWQLAGMIGRRRRCQPRAVANTMEMLRQFKWQAQRTRRPVKSLMFAIVLLAILIPAQPKRGFGLGMRTLPGTLQAKIPNKSARDNGGAVHRTPMQAAVAQQAMVSP